VFEELIDVRAHSGDSDFRHDGLSSRKTGEVSLVRILRLNVKDRNSKAGDGGHKILNGLWARSTSPT
jgi:hypothetical protein